ncbi:MAG: glutamate-1-semialdehyde 2,1-aminomutase [Kiritimatiellae bacterium]|nr:glutamate-1-semialdehyde 2,1-aminomutase [Kiritimatiellia bacterium]
MIAMKHAEVFRRGCRVIPGGVNSPVRAFNGVGGTPVFVVRGRRQKVETAEGRWLTDYCCSWGAMILGHAHPEVTRALRERAAKGTTFGIATPDEVVFAERLVSLVPGMEMVRAVSSGTEAVMTAIRLARGVTGRPLVLKFDGCYHGHSDAMLVKSGSGVLTMGASSSLGVTPGAVEDTLVVPYNDLEAVEAAFKVHGQRIAAAIVEPVAGNMGLVPPREGFLKGLRSITAKHGALLVCDEVINGFRFGLSTYSALYGGVSPDIVTLGKVIGGGLPLAAVGGRRRWMKQLAPTGPVYQAGTLSGNPLAVAAGLKTLEILERDLPYTRMAELGSALAVGASTIAAEHGLPIRCQSFNGVFTFFCTEQPVTDLASAKMADTRLYARMFHGLLDRGIYLAPSQFECNFISAAHTARDVDALLDRFDDVCGRL